MQCAVEWLRNERCGQGRAEVGGAHECVLWLAGDGNELRGQHITPFLTLLPDNPAPRCTLDSSTALFIVAHSSRLVRTFAIDVTEGAQLTLKEAQQFSTELSYRLQVT